MANRKSSRFDAGESRSGRSTGGTGTGGATTSFGALSADMTSAARALSVGDTQTFPLVHGRTPLPALPPHRPLGIPGRPREPARVVRVAPDGNSRHRGEG